jgi:hypothetical protein
MQGRSIVTEAFNPKPNPSAAPLTSPVKSIRKTKSPFPLSLRVLKSRFQRFISLVTTKSHAILPRSLEIFPAFRPFSTNSFPQAN